MCLLQVLIFHDGSNAEDMKAFAAGVASFIILLVHLVATTIVSASLNEAVWKALFSQPHTSKTSNGLSVRDCHERAFRNAKCVVLESPSISYMPCAVFMRVDVKYCIKLMGKAALLTAAPGFYLISSTSQHCLWEHSDE